MGANRVNECREKRLIQLKFDSRFLFRGFVTVFMSLMQNTKNSLVTSKTSYERKDQQRSKNLCEGKSQSKGWGPSRLGLKSKRIIKKSHSYNRRICIYIFRTHSKNAKKERVPKLHYNNDTQLDVISCAPKGKHKILSHLKVMATINEDN